MAAISGGTNTAVTARPGYDGTGLKLTYTTPRLNKKNYVDWAAKTEILLDIQGVWTIISGEKRQPNEGAIAEVIQNWRQRNGIARAILGGSIDENEY